MGKTMRGSARTLRADFFEQQWRKADDRVDQGEPAEDAAAD